MTLSDLLHWALIVPAFVILNAGAVLLVFITCDICRDVINNFRRR